MIERATSTSKFGDTPSPRQRPSDSASSRIAALVVYALSLPVFVLASVEIRVIVYSLGTRLNTGRGYYLSTTLWGAMEYVHLPERSLFLIPCLLAEEELLRRTITKSLGRRG